jgi:hypothetical protein
MLLRYAAPPPVPLVVGFPLLPTRRLLLPRAHHGCANADACLTLPRVSLYLSSLSRLRVYFRLFGLCVLLYLSSLLRLRVYFRLFGPRVLLYLSSLLRLRVYLR